MVTAWPVLPVIDAVIVSKKTGLTPCLKQDIFFSLIPFNFKIDFICSEKTCHRTTSLLKEPNELINSFMRYFILNAVGSFCETVKGNSADTIFDSCKGSFCLLLITHAVQTLIAGLTVHAFIDLANKRVPFAQETGTW